MRDRTSRSRSFLALVALAAIGLAGALDVNARSPQSAAERPASDVIINRYCVSCHNGRLKTAGLELDTLDVHRVGDAAQQWEKVVTKLRTGEMPPPGRPRPDADTYRAVASALERELDAAAAAKPHPGRVAVHRLNRAEYTN